MNVGRGIKGAGWALRPALAAGFLMLGFGAALADDQGALLPASSGEFQSGTQTVLNQGTYAPCGQCVDAKGRKIGWQVKTARIIYHTRSETITLEQPTLYLLGVPVAWLPWLTMPDPTK